MGSKKLLITGAVIAAVAATALLVPAIASGAPPTPMLPATSVVAPDDSPGGPGNGKAWGHHKDDPDFPGDNGNAKRDKQGDGPGNGNAWGHHKDDPDFPGSNGQARGNPHQQPDED
ncbi:hypothetical protein [Microbacterium sp. NPDC056569]|uniref:hypothetical protein n=1 Tax=Microbacterium sp. NPDC056569 TaxID=3345867 RepID=UPI00366DD49A